MSESIISMVCACVCVDIRVVGIGDESYGQFLLLPHSRTSS